jgi:hypothetical protein
MIQNWYLFAFEFELNSIQQQSTAAAAEYTYELVFTYKIKNDRLNCRKDLEKVKG